MLHKSTIKSAVNKQFPTVKIISIEHKTFGIFVVKVKKETPKTVKTGFIIGETDYDKSANGVVLDKNISW